MAKTQQQATKTRLSLDLTDAFHERLEGLRQLIEADSKAEVIREALQVLEYLAEKVQQGSRLQIANPDGTVEIIRLFLNLPRKIQPKPKAAVHEIELVEA